MPVCREMSMTTGSIKAATATLFITADMTPAVTMITAIMKASLRPIIFRTKRPMMLATPVRVKPPLMINTAHTVITAGLLNPDSACTGDTRPVSATEPRASSAVTYMGIHSVTSNTTDTPRIEKTRAISMVMAISPHGAS